MLAGQLALTFAAVFFGAAIYVNIAEQPARFHLADSALLMEWKPAYARGFAMQAPLTVVGCLCGLIAWWQTQDWRWSIGALLLIANVPYTLLVIIPTNTVLMNTAAADAGPQTRSLLVKWGRLHAVRSLLGLGATLGFLWAGAASG